MSTLDPDDPLLLAGDVDFYCFHCGYNLRGLSGDPKRCPECGHLNPIRDLIVPAEAITRQLRKLETAPTLCFIAILMAWVGVLGLYLSIVHDGCILVCFLALGPLLWGGGAESFAGSCERKPGWRMALARFHGYAVVIFCVGVGLPVAVSWVAIAVTQRWFPGTLNSTLAAAFSGIGLFVLLYYSVAKPLYSKAKADFKELQQQTALEMARRWRRTQLRRQQTRRL